MRRPACCLPPACQQTCALQGPELSPLGGWVLNWLVWCAAAVEQNGQVPPGNVAGNTRWTARRARPEVRLTPGKGLADLKCSVEDLIDGVVKGNKVRTRRPC